MSITSAPALAIAFACATAAVVSLAMPSPEKESGVTLRMPITHVRSPHGNGWLTRRLAQNSNLVHQVCGAQVALQHVHDVAPHGGFHFAQSAAGQSQPAGQSKIAVLQQPQ